MYYILIEKSKSCPGNGCIQCIYYIRVYSTEMNDFRGVIITSATQARGA